MDLFGEQEERSTKIKGLQVNKDFADAFDKRKRAEELSKLHDKYGANDQESESSTDYSSEDSEAELATPAVDVAILKTLARIRSGDATIYEPGRNVFDEEESSLPVASTSKAGINGKASKHETPLSLSAYQRQTLLAGGAQEEDGGGSTLNQLKTPAQEADALRRETTAAFHTAVGSDSEEGDDDDTLLVPRLKTEDEELREQAEYREFLQKEAGPATLQLDDEDTFLRNYILNRGWIDKQSGHIPTQDEILESAVSSKKKGKAKELAYEPLIEDDEDFEERAEDFEHKYNFRFEQSGGSELVTHSRNVEDSVRRPDLDRKEKRKAAAEAKAKRKEEKLRIKAEQREEKDRLRLLQDSANRERLEKLREVVGTGVTGIEAMDFEADFDPEEHDRLMARLFDEGFYGDESADAAGKPEWQDSDVDEHLPYMNAQDEEAYDPSAPAHKESKKERKKKRKREAAHHAETQEEDSHQRDDYNAYFDRFEFEDLVDEQPTRFRYANVEPAAFELTPEEILLATDAELNTYVGLSKLHTYRKSGPPKNRSRRRKELRSILAKRAWGNEVDREDIRLASELLQRRHPRPPGLTGANASIVQPRKRKGKKEREKESKRHVEADM